jgi:hypothetical protein
LDPTADEIERHIEDCLARLRSNLNEIEQRAKSFIDWREQYRRRPGTALSFAFGVGLLVAGLAGWKTREVAPQRRFVDRRGSPHTDQLSRIWDNVQRELIGVATAVVADAVAKLVFGFKEQRIPGTRFTSNTNEGNGVQREGDYRAARRYRRAAECLIDTVDAARVPRAASPRTEATEMTEEAKQTVDRAPRPRDVAAAASPGGPDHIGRRCNPGPRS